MADKQGGCRFSWFHGFLAQARNDTSARNASWRAAIRCETGYIHLLQKILPDDAAFAQYAVQVQPGASSSWFWLAETIYAVTRPGQEDPDQLPEEQRKEAIAYFEKGLSLNPNDGLRWRELGDLLRSTNPQSAIKAYLQSCFNGDPHHNGCWRAGSTAESLGDIESAIQYYRYSRWPGAHTRANELEAQLTTPTP